MTTGLLDPLKCVGSVATAHNFSTIPTVVRPVHKLQALYNLLSRNKQETQAMAFQSANTAKSVQS